MSMKKVIPAILAALLLTISSAALASTMVLPEEIRVIEAEAFYGTDLADTEVRLPEGIESIGSKAFANTGLKRIHLPDHLDNIAEDAFDKIDGFVIGAKPGTAAYAWAKAHQFDIDDGTLKITRIRVNRSVGAMTEDTATWTVETNDDSLVDSYGYELTLNGETLDTVSGSESPTYTAAIEQAGRYQLNVTVTAADGSTVTGSSTLYISEEAAEIECPESLENGENLEIRIQEAEDAIEYGIVVAEAESGKRIYSASYTAPRTVTIQGYLLDAGEYQVYGYVYGDSYRCAVSAVRTVSVTGTKPAAPAASLQSVALRPNYGNYWQISFSVTAEGAEKVVSRSWAPGTTSVSYSLYSDPAQISAEVSAGIGTVRNYSFSVYAEGKWSAWSETVQVTFTEENESELVPLD